MVVIYFVPIGLILVFALFILGGAYSLLSSLTKIIFGVTFAIMLISGIIYIGYSIVKFLDKEKKNIFQLLADIISGVFIAAIVPLVANWFEIGIGTNIFSNSEFILLGTFEKLDENLATCIVSLIFVSLLFLPKIFLKGKLDTVFSIVSLCFCCVVFFGGYSLSFKNEMTNSYNSFNWDSVEFSVTENTPIYHSADLGEWIKTGSFKKDTLLYKSNIDRTYNETEYVFVSDGKKAGYVELAKLESLVTYTYVVNKDSNIYNITTRDAQVWFSEENPIVTFNVPGEEIIAEVNEGTEVTKIEIHSSPYVADKYMLIKLPDGTEGYILFDNITEIRK